jgi:hypothetical protein
MAGAGRPRRGRLPVLVPLVGMLLFGSACTGAHTGAPAASTAPGSTAPVSTGPVGTGGSGTGTAPTVTVPAALVTAWTAEHEAKASYDNVVVRLGERGPFANVSAAESQHIATLAALARVHSVALPSGPFVGQVAPATLAAACQMGVTLEQEMIAMYGRLQGEVVSAPDLVQAFGNLRANSEANHLPAFLHCVG